MKKVLKTIVIILILSTMIFPVSAFAEKGAAADTFSKYLDNEGTIYTYKGKTDNGEDIFLISFGGDNTDVTVNLFFDNDDTGAVLYVWNLYEIKPSQADECIKVCNDLNSRYRFVKFYYDESDCTVTVQSDVIFRADDIGELCNEIVHRTAFLSDEGYLVLQEALG